MARQVSVQILKRLARWLTFGALTGIFVFVLILAGYFWWVHPGYDPLSFSKESWAVADAETRGHMVEDLLENYVHEGMSQAEILDLLGPPGGVATVKEEYAQKWNMADPKAFDTLYVKQSPGLLSEVVYGVGYMGWRREAPMVFDYALVIRFRHGRVEAAYVQD